MTLYFPHLIVFFSLPIVLIFFYDCHEMRMVGCRASVAQRQNCSIAIATEKTTAPPATTTCPAYLTCRMGIITSMTKPKGSNNLLALLNRARLLSTAPYCTSFICTVSLSGSQSNSTTLLLGASKHPIFFSL